MKTTLLSSLQYCPSHCEASRRYFSCSVKFSGERRGIKENIRESMCPWLCTNHIFLLTSRDIVSNIRPRLPLVADIIRCPSRQPVSPLQVPATVQWTVSCECRLLLQWWCHLKQRPCLSACRLRFSPSRWGLPWLTQKCSREFGGAHVLGAASSSGGREPRPSSFRWTILGGIPNASPCFWWDYALVASSSLHNFSHSLSCFLLFLLLPGISFRINCLHPGLCLRLCFWETQTRTLSNIANTAL